MYNQHSNTHLDIQGGYVQRIGQTMFIFPYHMKGEKNIHLLSEIDLCGSTVLNHGRESRRATKQVIVPVVQPSFSELPSGYVKIAMERSTIFSGKTHYFYGHVQ